MPIIDEMEDNNEFDSLIDIFNHIETQLEKVSEIDISKIKCQSINFMIEKLKNKSRKALLLGEIQSGKTNEIIQLSKFVYHHLNVPIIILLQNKKAGISQLVERINQVNKNIDGKVLEYILVGSKSCSKMKLSKLFNTETPSSKIIISLSNTVQLKKLLNAIELSTNNNIIPPYVCFVDEFDDSVLKSRQDIDNNSDRMKTEVPAQKIIKNSVLTLGISATLMAFFMQAYSYTIDDIFKLKPSTDYVGYVSDRLEIIDIKEYISKKINKYTTRLSIDNYKIIINNILLSLDNTKNYTITLLNISDKKEDHDSFYNLMLNEYDEWSTIKFHSNDEDKIIASLPSSTNSNYFNAIKKILRVNHLSIYEYYNDGPEALIKIRKNIRKFKQTNEIMDKISQCIDNEEDLYMETYEIEFYNQSIQEILTELLKFTNKICVLSGRMATRGISFVNNNYTKHITDLIYIPSDNSHATRNVQDMRIFGNFKQDSIKLSLYCDEGLFLDTIYKYVDTQQDILNSVTNDISIKKSLMTMPLDASKLPKKKIDRDKVIKGLKFSNSDYGISLSTKILDEAITKLREIYKNNDIIIYSEIFSNVEINEQKLIDENKYPIYPNKKNQFSKFYKSIIEQNFDHSINTVWHILDKTNAYPLWNPLKIDNAISGKNKFIDVCYVINKDNCTLDLVVKNNDFNTDNIDEIDDNTIILFGSLDPITTNKLTYSYIVTSNSNDVLTDKFVTNCKIPINEKSPQKFDNPLYL